MSRPVDADAPICPASGPDASASNPLPVRQNAPTSANPVDGAVASRAGRVDAADMTNACSLEASGRLDGCGECVVNTEAPRDWIATTDGYRCAYLCADCGHAWTTDWKAA